MSRIARTDNQAYQNLIILLFFRKFLNKFHREFKFCTRDFCSRFAIFGLFEN